MEPEDIIRMAVGPVVEFDFDAVADRLDRREEGGHGVGGGRRGDSEFDHELFASGMLRVMDWITRADPTAVVCSPKTLISVRTMAFVWQVFPALIGGKSQLKLGKELGVSRQFFSRQVIDFRRTFGLRGDPRKMRLKGSRKAQALETRRGRSA